MRADGAEGRDVQDVRRLAGNPAAPTLSSTAVFPARLIKEGRVLLQGRAVKANQLVRTGQEVSVAIPEPVEPEPKGFSITRSPAVSPLRFESKPD